MGITDSVDYMTAKGWLSHKPASGWSFAGAQFVELKPYEAQVKVMRFPTNTSWKLRVHYYEQARGMVGMLSRTADFLFGLFERNKNTSYTGASYLAETSEIPN